MKHLYLTVGLLLAVVSATKAEVVEQEDSALSVFGEACEEIKAGEQNAPARIKATDKACFSAVSALPEIIDIKDSFDEHDFNVMVYNIVDEYIEDLTTKTLRQDDNQICIEVSGYITPESIGKAIDKTIKSPATQQKMVSLQDDDEEDDSLDNSLATLNIPEQSVLPTPPNSVLVNTFYVRPTEFYNNTKSNSHSGILKKILSQSENVQVMTREEDANFIVTPQVLKAKIEPLNSETNRMQMVLALEIFDRLKNDTTTEHQNKFILFSTNENEQAIAKDLLTQLFKQGSVSLLKMADQSSAQSIKKHAHGISDTAVITQ